MNLPLNSITKVIALFLFYFLIYSESKASYCTTALGGSGCNAADQITGVQIYGTSLINLNNNCSGPTTNTYTSFPATGNTTATIQCGVTYTLGVTTSANNSIFGWIDYNQNQVFDPSEYFEVSISSQANSETQLQFTPPLTALLGTTKMRIRTHMAGFFNNNADACVYFSGHGETEDYTINILAQPVCSGVPTPGTIKASTLQVCPNDTLFLSLNGATQGSGLTYFWQASQDSINWSTLLLDTLANFSKLQTTSTYYRCIIFCSGQSAITNTIFVKSICYCNSGVSSGFSPRRNIGNIQLATLNNGSGDTLLSNLQLFYNYSDFTGINPTVLTQNTTYPINFTITNYPLSNITLTLSIYIDFNQNGVFNTPSERILSKLVPVGINQLSGSIIIPYSALPGITRMRIVLQDTISSPYNSVPCNSYHDGETEDYLVNIVQPACSITPTGGSAACNQNLICENSAIHLYLTGSTLGTGLSYQWQSSIDNLNWININGAVNDTCNIVIMDTSYYRCIVSCSGVSAISGVKYIAIRPFYECICASNAISVGSNIGQVIFVSINNGNPIPYLNNGTAYNTYTNFTALPPPQLHQGFTYPIYIARITSLSVMTFAYFTVHFDFDHNGAFNDSTEVYPLGQLLSANSISGAINIPYTAMEGKTLMRIVMNSTATGSANQSPCGTYQYGETEDYFVTILKDSACLNVPPLGKTIASDTSLCTPKIIQLSVTANSMLSGMSYQWQSSVDTINWTDIAGATIATYSLSVSTTTYFRCRQSCSLNAAYSKYVAVVREPFYKCYCTSASFYSSKEDIGWFQFGPIQTGTDSSAINNVSAVNVRTDFLNLFPERFNRGSTYPVKVIGINSSAAYHNCYLNIFIDYNQNGSFSANELAFSANTNSGSSGNLMQGTITIPAGATIGITGLRAILSEDSPISVCGLYSYGETEDYIINIDYALSIDENKTSSSVLIYPNPASEKLIISCIGASTKKHIFKLFNLQGQLIYEDFLYGNNTKEIDVNTFSKGIYMMQVISDLEISTNKIMIK